MKLSVKIPLLIGIAVLAISVSLGLLALQASSTALTRSVISALQAENEANAKLMSSVLYQEYIVLYEIANSALVRTLEWDTIKPILLGEVTRLQAQQIAISAPNGNWRSVMTDATTNVIDRVYFKRAMAREVSIDIVVGRVTGMPVLVMAVPIYQSNERNAPIIGVLSAEKDGTEYLTDIMLRNLKVGMPSGYCFIMDTTSGQAITIAHKDRELVTKRYTPEEEAKKDPSLVSFGDMFTRSVSLRNGEADYTRDGKRYLGYFNELPLFGNWILYSSVEKVDVDSQLTRMRSTIFLAGIASIVVGIIVAFFIGRSIARPVAQVANELENVAKGDLTRNVSVKSNDEIGQLAIHFNETIGNIKSMIFSIKNETNILSDVGTDLARKMTEAATSVSDITSSIKNIKSRVDNQSASVTTTNATMEAITDNINKLNEHVEKQSESVSKSSASIEQMLANIKSVTDTLVKNGANVTTLQEASEVGRTGLQEVATDIQEIARESEGLLEINAVMENIASQTNLLSMNAAIEAAHAGDAGKGFAVVADEIRKLAESSSEQSKTISTVLKKIKSSIDKITQSTENVLNKFEAIDTSVKVVAQQEEGIRCTMEEQGQGSKQVLEAIGYLNDTTQQVKVGSNEMLNGTKEVVREGKNLQRATQEITSSMNEMASGADRINSTVSHVDGLSSKNRDAITILMQEVLRFKVE